ncbi:MAG: hypothetical protein ABMA13_05560 [Chthoniobacteraceae bacterium]
MSILQKETEDCETKAHPTANNAASAENAFETKSTSDRGGEDNERIVAEADQCNAKVHCYSRTVAREHGINASVVLTGFAYKLKHHRMNWWEDRWWYYETLEVLCKRRWPYWGPSGLCGMIEYLAGEDVNLLIKDSNNKASYDSTNWYAIEDKVRDDALSDLICFDVAVAKTLGIPAATIYHNLRFHLRLALKQDRANPLPYHKLNKKQLARDLPMDYSTVKRAVRSLVNAKLILAHPKKKSLFTLTDTSELGIVNSPTNGSSVNENGSSVNGSFVNRNGSNVNRNGSSVNGSFVNRNGSNVNRNGSSVNENGSNVNDYTQYEAIKKANEKPLRKDCSPGCVENIVADAANAEKHEGQQPFYETRSSACSFRSLDELQQAVHEQQDNIAKLRGDGPLAYVTNIMDACEGVLTEALDSTTVDEVLAMNSGDELVSRLCEPVDQYMSKALGQCVPPDTLSIYTVAVLHTLVGACLFRHKRSQEIVDAFDPHCEDIQSVARRITSMREERADGSPSQKTTIFLEGVKRYNKSGWPDSKDKIIEYNVSTPMGTRAKAQAAFEENEENTPAQFLQLLSQCVEAHVMKPVPDDHDKFWHARRGVELSFFFSQWGKIADKIALAQGLGEF